MKGQPADSTRRNAEVAPEFTHVRHYKNAGYINGNGEFVPTRFTVISRVEGDKVFYKVGFCSRSEANFDKRQGRESAHASEYVFEAPLEGNTFKEIENSIILDMVTSGKEYMPYAHQRFAQLVEQDLNL